MTHDGHNPLKAYFGILRASLFPTHGAFRKLVLNPGLVGV